MFKTGRWMYVLFTCQQTLEKTAKGLYHLYFESGMPPRTHNIMEVLRRFEDRLPKQISADTVKFLDELSGYYIDTRYADFTDQLSENTRKPQAFRVLNLPKEAFKWLQTLKP